MVFTLIESNYCDNDKLYYISNINDFIYQDDCYIYIKNLYPELKFYSNYTHGDKKEFIRFTNNENIIFCIIWE